MSWLTRERALACHTVSHYARQGRGLLARSNSIRRGGVGEPGVAGEGGGAPWSALHSARAAPPPARLSFSLTLPQAPRARRGSSPVAGAAGTAAERRGSPQPCPSASRSNAFPTSAPPRHCRGIAGEVEESEEPGRLPGVRLDSCVSPARFLVLACALQETDPRSLLLHIDSERHSARSSLPSERDSVRGYPRAGLLGVGLSPLATALDHGWTARGQRSGRGAAGRG